MADVVGEKAGDSGRQVQRYIRLTELIPELLDMVDEKKIAFNPAYELSFLKKEEQVDLLDAMESEQATPSLSQAQRLKKYSQEGHLTLDMMRVIMGEEKKSDLDKITFTSDTLRKYFPRSYTPARMQETIIKLLEAWQRKRQQRPGAMKGAPMRDISARELKGHNILGRGAVSGQYPLDDRVFRPAPRLLRQPRRRGAAVSHRGRLSGRLAQPAAPGDQNQAVRPRDRGAYPRFQAEKAPPPPVNPPLTRKGLNYVYR